MDNTCVCCGELIPEGIQVCPACVKLIENNRKDELTNERTRNIWQGWKDD